MRDHEFSYENHPKVAPDNIGRFVVLREVTAEQTGSQALVYEALDPITGDKVALKILEHEMESFSASIMAALMRDNDIKDILSESEILSGLQHPNVVSIVETGDDPVLGPYIAMEWVGGGNLNQSIYGENSYNGTRFSSQKCVLISMQILKGLSAAHKFGVVHGDIKPSNVLIDLDGGIKLADFGVARLTQQDYGGPFRGTRGYLAPERENFDALDELAHTADIYSVGIVMLEMLVGEIPSRHEQIMPLLATIPKPLDDIIRKATAYVPQERYVSAQAMIEALSESLGKSSPYRINCLDCHQRQL